MKRPPIPGKTRFCASAFGGYTPQILDQLCLTGAVGWGRLSPHPATLEAVTSGGRRVIPTSVAPIAFFVRDDADWMAARRGHDGNQAQGLSAAAREVHAFLRERGASFFPDIVRGTGRLKSEVETGLWELVTAGLITADGFDNLRALIDPKRRSGHGTGRTARPRHSSGRWSLLYVAESSITPDRDRALEAICNVLLRRYGVVFREALAPREHPAAVARTARHAAPPGRSRRSARRQIRHRFSGRAIRAADRRRVSARHASRTRTGRNRDRLRSRSAQSGRQSSSPAIASRPIRAQFVTFRDGAAAENSVAPIAAMSAAL